jgi:putative methionine-R-sulfoxide reductase with GAF domain
MTAVARCPRSHEWEVHDDLLSIQHPTAVHCPLCGELGVVQVTVKVGGPHETDADARTVIPGSGPLPEEQGSADLWRELGYEVLGVLGRGGMGMVVKARQIQLDRLVALKMVHAHIGPDDPAHARFQAEARAVASLQHPHIVQIYEVGELRGSPFLALEYVGGGTLSQKLKKTSYSPRQAAQLVETLATTIHAAHQRGIIHRDLKPGNILLAEDGSPKITDFGLVKRFVFPDGAAGEPALTQTGEVLGTPSYMAPEQAIGLRSSMGPVTDVYALGAILYELLTHRPPFEGDSPMQTVWQVIKDEPIPPIQLSPRVSRDLQTICLTCLQKETTRRYPSADKLAEDLRAFLAGEPIRARPPGMWERFTIWVKRHPVGAGLLGLGAAAVLALVIGVWFFSSLAVTGLAVLVLVSASWWHNIRLQQALRRMDEEHLAVERNLERLYLLLETNQRLLRAESLEDLLRLLSETTTQLVNADRATVYLIDADKKELWSKVALGEGVGEIRLPLGTGIAGTVAATGETINLDDPYTDPRFSPETDQRTGYRTRNLLTFAMRGDKGQILGVFQVLNKRTGGFSPEDVELLQLLADSVAVVVTKVQKERRNRGGSPS